MAVLFVVAMSLPGPARAQSDNDQVPEILLHPRVSTILKLPDVIVDARLLHRGEIQFVIVDDDKLYIRPLPGAPAGTEALLEVETQTGHRTFNVRVVRRARDATRDVLILPPAGHEQSISTLPPVALMAPPVAPPVAPEAPPVTQVAPPAAPPVAPEPALMPPEPVTARDVEPTTDGATAIPRPRRIELSVHGFAALGTTAFHVPEDAPINARQSHRAFGVRVTGSPPGTWWAVEANVSAELPVTPTTHLNVGEGGARVLEADGPRLRADVGLRGRFGTRLVPNFYAGIGLQAHYLDIEDSEERASNRLTRDLPFEGVLALGFGLEYQARDMFLGIELHVRQGVPAGYRSVAGLLSVGWYLD